MHAINNYIHVILNAVKDPLNREPNFATRRSFTAFRMTLVAGCLALTACHHDNPLATHSKQQSATFLMNASANLERRLRLDVKNDEHGYGYLECMEGKKNHEIHCETLYQGMIAFAKEGHYPGFEAITLKNLTNQAMFTGLSDDYYEVMASTWPVYYPADK